jgi:tripartite-type tricarboxylate transporter receptor subunit TctC
MLGIKSLLRNTVVAAALAAAVPFAFAQGFPNKAVKLIVPFTPGSGTDIVARAISDRLGQNLGQPVIVENRPGAGGTIGASVVAASAPDGYTLLIHSSAHTVNPHIYEKLSFDTLKDFAGITPLASLPNVLIVPPTKGIKSVKELVAAAKANPGALNYGSAGTGSATHMNAEKFRLMAGFDALHVPFKGTPEVITEIVTGRLDYFFAPLVSALSNIRDGKVLALAVGTARRSSMLPDLPTTVEAGVPGSDYTFWVGLMAPSKTPHDIVVKLNQEVVKALAAPEIKDRFAKLGAEPMPMTPEQFDAYIRDELAANAKIVKAAGIKAN